MWKYILSGCAILAVVLFGFSLLEVRHDGAVSASAVLVDVPTAIKGYTRAVEPYDWQFPADFGPHPDFQTEWWYYTGNLADAAGNRYGFQLTFFQLRFNIGYGYKLYVFLLDPWWNPAVEQQAIDRAHRIGQENKVFIYKFITKNTVEEKILKLQQKKVKLAADLITTEESFVKDLSKEDIELLLE